jgi:hypothetical protein
MAKVKNKKYPSWFRYYSPPRPPVMPPEKQYNYTEILRIVTTEHGGWEDFDPSALKDADCIQLIINEYDHEIQFAKKEIIDNPHYKKQKKHYEKELAEYKIKAAEWQKYKDQWDLETVAKNKSQRKKLYQELKKEFEK